VDTDKKKEAYGFLRYSRFLIRYRCKLKLSDQECMVILSVMDYADNKRWGKQHPFPSNKAVADKMGCSERKVHTQSARLKSKGLLNRKEGGSKPEWDFTNLYSQLDKFDDDTTRDKGGLGAGETTHNQDSTTQDTETTRQHESKTTQVKGTTSHVSAPEVTREVIEVNNKEKRSKESSSSSFNNSNNLKVNSTVTTGSNASIDPELIKKARKYKDGELRDHLNMFKQFISIRNPHTTYCLKMREKGFGTVLKLPEFDPDYIDFDEFKYKENYV